MLKSINHPVAANDPGKDDVSSGISQDVFGMTLEYFSGDYSRSGTNISSIATGGTADYSGNIMGQSWRSQKPQAVVTANGAGVNDPAMFTYSYDDKYQFGSNKFGVPNFTGSSFTETLNANKEHSLAYDANGNITTLKRNNAAGTTTANYTYNYLTGTNKLSSVNNYASYTYDALGQMASQVRTAGNQGYYVDYDVNGKVTAIYSNSAKTTLRVSFAYDESGNRIKKTDHIQNTTTYYVYDIAGNVLSIYDNVGTSLQQKELPVYAANRVGIYNRPSNSYKYELTDNLGNVRVVINGTKKSNGEADVVYYSDYYPFGSPLTLAANDYRYGYQGQYAEVDKETGWNNFDLRMYDAEIGRWMSPDPKNQYASPYLAMGNNPIMKVDPDGGKDGDPKNEYYLTKDGYVSPYALNEINVVGKAIKPYTTSDLRYDAYRAGIISSNMLEVNRIVGRAFQAHALSSFGYKENTTSFISRERAARAGISSVIPDAIGDIKVNFITFTGIKRDVYPRSSFVEVKAVKGVIGLSYDNYQIAGLLDAAANSPAGAVGAANVTFITTANTIISPDVLLKAQQLQVQVHQSFAYKIDGTNSVGFSPVFPLTLNGHKGISLPAPGGLPHSISFPKM